MSVEAVAVGNTGRQVVLPDDKTDTNPFRIPPENEIFQLRDAERRKLKAERERQRSLRAHEKTTYAQKMRARTLKARNPFGDEDEDVTHGSHDHIMGQDDSLQLAARDKHVEKEDLASFVAKKREMFLVQYSLGVKRDEMRKLEEIAQAEEKKLMKAEQFLEEDAMMFDEFLKENDKNSVEAIKQADLETKAKMEKVQEIKRIQAQITGLKSEISKNEDQLKEYQTYKRFLETLTPPEWKVERQVRRTARRGDKPKKNPETKAASLASSRTHKRMSRVDSRRARKSIAPDSESLISAGSTSMENAIAESDYDSDDSCELYFTDPHQLLDIFSELEEQNLSLIQNSQETEEALDEMKQTIENTKAKMNKETEVLKSQITSLEQQIAAEARQSFYWLDNPFTG